MEFSVGQAWRLLDAEHPEHIIVYKDPQILHYITNMRSHLQLSQKIIIATAILFNIKKEWEGQTTSEPYEVPTIRPRVQLSAREILQDGKRQREIITQAMQPI